MTYKPSPRPTFTEPTHLAYATVTRHLWGDPEAGEVADWIYVSSDKIHQLLFALAPGGLFRHSSEFRTIFAADEIYYVISGVMVIANPETGEVQRVNPGEAAFFRRDTWHHAFNYSRETLRVLEFFAPPPSQVPSNRDVTHRSGGGGGGRLQQLLEGAPADGALSIRDEPHVDVHERRAPVPDALEAVATDPEAWWAPGRDIPLVEFGTDVAGCTQQVLEHHVRVQIDQRANTTG